jgi:hypothetical protein
MAGQEATEIEAEGECAIELEAMVRRLLGREKRRNDKFARSETVGDAESDHRVSDNRAAICWIAQHAAIRNGRVCFLKDADEINLAQAEGRISTTPVPARKGGFQPGGCSAPFFLRSIASRGRFTETRQLAHQCGAGAGPVVRGPFRSPRGAVARGRGMCTG